MASCKVQFNSYNINGLLNPIQRSNILSKMKQEQALVVQLQETHLSNNDHGKLKRMGFRHINQGIEKVTYTYRQNFESVFEMGNKEGRFILVRGNIDGHPVTFYMQQKKGQI